MRMPSLIQWLIPSNQTMRKGTTREGSVAPSLIDPFLLDYHIKHIEDGEVYVGNRGI